MKSCLNRKVRYPLLVFFFCVQMSLVAGMITFSPNHGGWLPVISAWMSGIIMGTLL